MRLLLTFILLLLVSACVSVPKKPKYKMVIKKTSFSSLNEWHKDDHLAGVKSFVNSCQKLMNMEETKFIGKNKIFGQAFHWRPACQKAIELNQTHSSADARIFFESYFTPYIVKNYNNDIGLFTGYYEIDLKGSYFKSEKYLHPIYAHPEKHHSKHSRKDIRNGALSGKQLELFFVEDEARLFFLHIQGSGRIILPDGSVTRVAYAGQNGHQYNSIGNAVAEAAEIEKHLINAEFIMKWLREHPAEAKEIMDKNASYVYFRANPHDNIVGAQNVPLTPQRSLAVDRSLIALGTPIWLETTYPVIGKPSKIPYRRLLIAQDTGGAIKGPVRGDIFFGNGVEAERHASYMKNRGRYYILLPKSLIVSN